MIFVFGSNLGGIHGAGAAAYAYKHHGAIFYIGSGHHGNSYAIPTKDVRSVGDFVMVGDSMPIHHIEKYVKLFLLYAKNNPQLQFQVTQIGCGLAGYDAADIAPLFIGGQDNIFYDTAWKDYLTDDSHFWGTL